MGNILSNIQMEIMYIIYIIYVLYSESLFNVKIRISCLCPKCQDFLPAVNSNKQIRKSQTSAVLVNILIMEVYEEYILLVNIVPTIELYLNVELIIQSTSNIFIRLYITLIYIIYIAY